MEGKKVVQDIYMYDQWDISASLPQVLGSEDAEIKDKDATVNRMKYAGIDHPRAQL